MCGRYTLRTSPADLAEIFAVLREPEIRPRYNIAPTQQVLVVRQPEEEREFALLRWGLIPSWAKDKKIASSLINARADTVATKPSFRSAFKKRRCLIVADGFYEWHRTDDGKQPYHFTMTDGKPFAFAGLWEHWHQGDETIESCSIITTDANELMEPLHNRMPVILPRDAYDVWLDCDVPGAEVEKLLVPYPAKAMTATPVSTVVNNARNETHECLFPRVERLA